MLIFRLIGLICLLPFLLLYAIFVDLPRWIIRVIRWQFVRARTTPAELRNVAAHEAAHALLAWRSTYHEIAKVTLRTRWRPNIRGYCLARFHRGTAPKEAYVIAAAYSVAGMCAEAIAPGANGEAVIAEFLRQSDFCAATGAMLKSLHVSDDRIIQSLIDIRAWQTGAKTGHEMEMTVVAHLESLKPALVFATLTLIAEAEAHALVTEALLVRRTLRPKRLREILGPSARERALTATP